MPQRADRVTAAMKWGRMEHKCSVHKCPVHKCSVPHPFAALSRMGGKPRNSTHPDYEEFPMALTESTMLSLGTIAPDFALTDVVTGKIVRRDDFRGNKALLVL